MESGLRKILPFVLWYLRKLFRRMGDNEWLSDFKASVVVACTEILAFMGAISVVSVTLGYRVLPASKVTFGALMMFVIAPIAIWNLKALRHLKRGAKLNAEFEGYSRTFVNRRGAMILVLLMAIVVGAFFAMAEARRLPHDRPAKSIGTYTEEDGRNGLELSIMTETGILS